MSFLVRPVEALRSEVIAIQAEKQNAELASGVKRFAAAAFPPGGGKGPSNLNDLSVYSKYMKNFAKDVRNRLPDLDLKYFNKQNLTKYFKYLA